MNVATGVIVVRLAKKWVVLLALLPAMTLGIERITADKTLRTGPARIEYRGPNKTDITTQETTCPQPSSNCQPNDNNIAWTSSGTNFRVADDFRLAAGGPVSQVCFLGGYFESTLSTDCGPVGQNNFLIRYYSDSGGVPGAEIATFSEAAGTLEIAGPLPTTGMIAHALAEFEFIGLHAPITLSAERCYWLEITNNLGSSCSWVWEGGLTGDDWLMQDIGSTGYTIEDALPGDLSFCLDQELADVSTCKPPPPPNDNCVSPTGIEGVGDFPFDNRTATTDGFPHTACQYFGEDQINGDVWYRWTTPCTDNVLIWTCGLTQVDTRLAVYEGCGSCPPDDVNLVTCNDDGCGSEPGGQSFVAFEAVAGQSYLIRVGSFPGANGGSGQFHISCGAPNNAACPGEGDCCASSGTDTPGCVDPSCCELICACDPFCCTEAWDAACAGNGVGGNGCGAQILCQDRCGVCGNAEVDCCIGVQGGWGIAGCENQECCETVCAADPFCCEIEWDVDCATDGFNGSGNGARILCPALCGGNDCNNNGVPDDEEIANGSSDDCNLNGSPDECESDQDGDGIIDDCDGCRTDPLKIEPGICGCGCPDIDTDNDGLLDCNDGCPGDPFKSEPGQCGCGVSDIDSDKDGTADCNDGCPDDPLKSEPGQCGCGVSDIDSDKDGTADCNDGCPADPFKISAGLCGCGESDVDTDLDGTPNCNDRCPNDPTKITPGICGCGQPDNDSDGDGIANCVDNCPDTRNTDQQDSDGDGLGDTCDSDGIPMLSTWGIVVLAFLLLIVARINFGRRSRLRVE